MSHPPRTGINKRLFKLRFLPLYPMTVWLVLVAHTTELRLRIGVALALLGLAIRFWANGYVGDVKVNWTRSPGDAKVGRLVTAGPYAWVRHPLYLGSVLIGGGVCVIAGDIWVALTLLGFFLVVYRGKMSQEEGLLRDEIGTPYLIYHGAVPRWWPSTRRYANRQGAWRWDGIRASNEWKTVIWVVVLLIALYFREEFIQEHEAMFPMVWEWRHTVLLGLMTSAMALDGLIELKKRSAARARVAAVRQPVT